MSTGAIFTVLSHIPWGQVVENAPKVADGAAKLWSSVTGRGRKTAPANDLRASADAASSTETEVLRSQVRGLEEAVEHLSEQMQASSELIKALADQNAQLVQRIELNRIRLVRVSAAAAVVGAALVAAVAFLALRQ